MFQNVVFDIIYLTTKIFRAGRSPIFTRYTPEAGTGMLTSCSPKLGELAAACRLTEECVSRPTASNTRGFSNNSHYNSCKSI